MTHGERAGGVQAFADLVEEFAAAEPQLRLKQLIGRLRSPVRVAVDGRSGVGRTTVSAVLRQHGVTTAADVADADVRLLVIAEGLKPEDGMTSVTADSRISAATNPPMLIVLNKADLTGSAGGGAMANARRRAAEVRATAGAPTVPLVGLLAGVDAHTLDDELLGALRTMVTEPADLTSVDAFTASEHPVGASVRERLLAGLDRFGIAHAVVGLARGTEPADLPALFRVVSNVEAVLTELHSVAAPVRYGRLRSALAELNSLAIRFDEAALDGFLRSDAVVLTAMTAAVEVVEADGAAVDTRDDPPAHLRRARHWWRYGHGPVTALHRSCSADIVRGSMRLLDGRP